MSYTPTNWTTGDTITATKLNKMEQGIANAGSAMVLTITTTLLSKTLNKTFAEIYEALHNGTPCYIQYDYNYTADIDNEYVTGSVLAQVSEAYKYSDTYRVFASYASPAYFSAQSTTLSTPSVMVFEATDASSYPTLLKVVIVTVGSTQVQPNIF